ncbi:germination protein [Cavenderia fasciculata]|uniref:Germination protein n=1 Tax=Cavenderia fasciculata TaxID=261658 RepID=F4Q7C2_CACFS|nr:germination protein [Cavenderia fasciculata]EGG16304.1 germination protein [Cavenderia fasciculata]|eukprot:XP_004354688.1 germination protein [Cavenderia fasciculata]
MRQSALVVSTTFIFTFLVIILFQHNFVNSITVSDLSVASSNNIYLNKDSKCVYTFYLLISDNFDIVSIARQDTVPTNSINSTVYFGRQDTKSVHKVICSCAVAPFWNVSRPDSLFGTNGRLGESSFLVRLNNATSTGVLPTSYTLADTTAPAVPGSYMTIAVSSRPTFDINLPYPFGVAATSSTSKLLYNTSIDIPVSMYSTSLQTTVTLPVLPYATIPSNTVTYTASLTDSQAPTIQSIQYLRLKGTTALVTIVITDSTSGFSHLVFHADDGQAVTPLHLVSGTIYNGTYQRVIDYFEYPAQPSLVQMTVTFRPPAVDINLPVSLTMVYGDRNETFYGAYVNSQIGFQINFTLPQNLFTGTPDYTLRIPPVTYTSIDLHSWLDFSEIIPVTSNNGDEMPPIVTGYIPYSAGASSNLYGFEFNITERLNGFKQAIVHVQGTYDRVPLVFLLNDSDRVKGDQWNGAYRVQFAIDKNECTSQYYNITYMWTVDNAGFVGNSSDPNGISPLLNYLGGAISFYSNCSSAASDTVLPQLDSFNVSRQSLDTGNPDPTQTIYIQFSTSDNRYLSPRNIPLVYISTSNYYYYHNDQQPGSIVFDQVIGGKGLSSFTSLGVYATAIAMNKTNAQYTAQIKVPYGFGYPGNIYLSLYGISDYKNNMRGYSSNDLASLQFQSTISTTFSTGPIISTIDTNFASNYQNFGVPNSNNITLTGYKFGNIPENIRVEMNQSTTTTTTLTNNSFVLLSPMSMSTNSSSLIISLPSLNSDIIWFRVIVNTTMVSNSISIHIINFPTTTTTTTTTATTTTTPTTTTDSSSSTTSVTSSISSTTTTNSASATTSISSSTTTTTVISSASSILFTTTLITTSAAAAAVTTLFYNNNNNNNNTDTTQHNNSNNNNNNNNIGFVLSLFFVFQNKNYIFPSYPFETNRQKDIQTDRDSIQTKKDKEFKSLENIHCCLSVCLVANIFSFGCVHLTSLTLISQPIIFFIITPCISLANHQNWSLILPFILIIIDSLVLAGQREQQQHTDDYKQKKDP